jgi:hypothetical protein
LARQYGRYGYRKIAGLLEQAGWLVNDKRVARIWRREGLKVPKKQPSPLLPNLVFDTHSPCPARCGLPARLAM